MRFTPSLAASDWCLEELYVGWRAASAEADNAYAAWSAHPGRDRYAVYVAATDRADAAVARLAAEHARRTRISPQARPVRIECTS